MNDDDFRALEAARTRALVDRNLAAIDALHAPEYELITPAGRRFSRAGYLALIAAEPFYSAWEHGAMQVRRSPEMAAVRYLARLSFASGEVVECWHTDVYGLRGETWQAVWSQATRLAPGVTG